MNKLDVFGNFDVITQRKSVVWFVSHARPNSPLWRFCAVVCGVVDVIRIRIQTNQGWPVGPPSIDNLSVLDYNYETL